ncbi:tetratricopeptide repeat-containing response regulator [Marinibactrum halimedae]|uniref:Response regulator n=1 Tax=Marinibactrum halimedae TaxID=1444977 RepID=A0AA37T5N6_9GAMM|nr:tetratricopeptide repeat-containing response regulator [Marinibactrum halimedae]MCD9458404.1 response regulator [Marinibactrum halimedae]GLS26101.1 response regulator [Marinibactrum halimedae]
MAFRGYNKLKVLVLDDFDSFRMTVAKMLDSFGVKSIDTASSGEEALRMCQGGSYDLILSDFNLGAGRSGLQVLEELRHRGILRKRDVFVLVSAETSKSIVLAATDAEPDAYLSKPITARALQQRLDRVLSQRDQLQEVYKALDNGDVDTAIHDCYEKINSGHRLSGFCQKILGELLLEVNQLDEAEALYRSVLEIRSLDWAQLGMAKVQQLKGDLETAERWFKEVVEQHPLCLKAYDNLVEVYQTLEAKDAMQDVLMEAVKVSPLALLRQEKLAQVSATNGDFETSVRAYRKVVRLADKSIHKKSSQALEFAHSLVRLGEQDPSAAKDVHREALRVLDEASTNSDDAVYNMQSKLVQAQLLSQQGNTKAANQILDSFRQTLNKLEEPVPLEVELDFVKALGMTGVKAEVKDRLNELSVRLKDDEEGLKKLDQLLDEPMSKMNRKLVAKINKDGIKNYESKNFKAAISAFMHAKSLFPNHVGVRLNLVQSLLGEMEEYGCERELMDEAIGSLNKVTESIDAQHPQFKRFRQLQEIHRSLVLRNA